MIKMILKVVNETVGCDFERENSTREEEELIELLSDSCKIALDVAFDGKFTKNAILTDDGEIISNVEIEGEKKY